MKKLLILCILLLAAPGVRGQAAAVPDSLLEARITQAACSPYAFYRARLETYYNRAEFSDPEHTSGWYRVQDFLNWLKTAEPRLKQADINVWTERLPLCGELEAAREENPLARKRLAVYIGARYALERLGYEQPLDGISFAIHPRRGASDFANKVIFIPAPRTFSLPEFINLGVHEVAHLLPALAEENASASLGELAAYYTQSRFALPLHPAGGVCFSNGARHLSHTLANADACAQILNEYNSFLAGELLGNKLRAQDLLTYRTAPGWERSIAQTILDVLLLENGKLTFSTGKKGYAPSLKEYMSALLPPGVPAQPLVAFYTRWTEKLADVSAAVQGFKPVTLPEPGQPHEETPAAYFARQKTLEAFLSAHEHALKETLLQTLRESRLPAPPVPAGYI